MSERLDRIEAILERIAQQQAENINRLIQTVERLAVRS